MQSGFDKPGTDGDAAKKLDYTARVDYADEKFEWDIDKSALNAEKHGVTFDDATKVFDDPCGVEIYDEEHSALEPRFLRIGLSGEFLLIVIFTERARRIRIIHARRANRSMEKLYVEENS